MSGRILSSKSLQGEGSTLFRYPSYVQDIMGDIFSLGFGPFRWTIIVIDQCVESAIVGVVLSCMTCLGLHDNTIIARWVCTSGRPEDLATTDRLAKEVLEQQVGERRRDYSYF